MIRVSTRTHGIMDLALGATLLAAPFILNALNNNGSNNGRKKSSTGRKKSGSKNSRKNGIEKTLLPAMGAGILAQGLMTDHEISAVKALSVPAHLTMDLGLGAFMIAAPFLMNVNENLKIPMVALGVAQIGLALMTQTEPSYKQFNDDFDDFMEEEENESFVEELAEMI